MTSETHDESGRDGLRDEPSAGPASSDQAGEMAELEARVRILREELRVARDAAHGADARWATVEGRLRHVEYALEVAQAREKETGELVERLYELSGGDARRLEAMLDARSFQVYWKLIRPYRRLRGER